MQKSARHFEMMNGVKDVHNKYTKGISHLLLCNCTVNVE